MVARVLLVDDELHIVKAAEFKLKRHGFDVLCACDGEDAWERINERCPDLLVTDLQMPRLDGIGLIERLRACERYVSLPVFMLTAKGFELPVAELKRRLGVLDVLTKPFSPRDLCNRIQQVIGAPQAASVSTNVTAMLQEQI